jgi:hypothetical protein
VNWRRKGALLMLAVVVFWTAAPVYACLSAMQPMGQRCCCRGMAMHCGSPETCANGSCCQARRQRIVIAPVPPSTPQHAQKLAFVLHQAGLELLASSSAGYWNTFEAPPPKIPPGGAFLLRI